MFGRRKRDGYRVAGMVERLTPYEAVEPRVVADDDGVEPELVERAATLLAVMTTRQRRETIEQLLSPNDPDRGRRAVDALIESAFAIEDEMGHLRKVA